MPELPPSDHGDAQVLVLQEDQAAVDTDRLVLAGGGHAEVFAEDGQVLVQVVSGHLDSVALVRGVLTAPTLRVHGDLLDVVVVTDRGWDRTVLSGDLAHRWLFTRHWERRPDTAPTVALVGHAPPDRETVPGEPDPGGRLGTAIRLLGETVGAPRTLHAVDVFTRRVAADAPVDGAPGDRRTDPGVAAAAVEEAEAILAAWGPAPRSGLDAVAEVVDLLRARRDAGARVLVPSRDGVLAVSGSPAQPEAVQAASSVVLVDAPAEWLWGGPLRS